MRLWASMLLFMAFAAAALFAASIADRIGLGGTWFQEAVRNGIHIGLWISGAYLIVALLNHLFWEGFAAHLLQHPVPRLVRDIFAIVIFLLAAAGIIGLEFGQPVVGIWAVRVCGKQSTQEPNKPHRSRRSRRHTGQSAAIQRVCRGSVVPTSCAHGRHHRRHIGWDRGRHRRAGCIRPPGRTGRNYIQGHNKMYREITTRYAKDNIMSALVLREFLYQL